MSSQCNQKHPSLTIRPMDQIPTNGGHVLVDAARRAGTDGRVRDPRGADRADLPGVRRSRRRPGRCASRGERRVRGGGVRAGHGRAGCRGGVPGPRADERADLDDERAARPQRRSLRRRLDTGGDSGDERPAGRHRPRRARGADQQVGVQGALDRPARAHRGAGDPHRDHSAAWAGVARHPGRCARCGGDACARVRPLP